MDNEVYDPAWYEDTNGEASYDDAYHAGATAYQDMPQGGPPAGYGDTEDDHGDSYAPQEGSYNGAEYEPLTDPNSDIYQHPSFPQPDAVPYEPYPPYEDPDLYDTDSHVPPADSKPYKRTIFKPRTRKPNFALSVAVNVIRFLALFILVAGLCAVGAVIGIAKGYMDTAPVLDFSRVDDQAQTSFIFDYNGELITEYKGIENRVMVSIKAMPVYLQHAFVACEDARFYTHAGVDLKRIVGAFVANLSSSSTQGGSTITQQLIKQTILSDEQSYKRKIQEAYLAMQLESEYTKEEILEAYLNTIYLGENYYGVQVAANGYFGKALKDLTLRECAMLAGMTRNPYYYNPRRNFYIRTSDAQTDYTAVTNDRTNYVLRCMRDNQFITERQYQEALNPATAHVLVSEPGEGTGMYKYAHYVEYAVRDIVDAFLQMEKLENTPENRSRMEQKFRLGGYRVRLAIDTRIQETVEATLENYKNYPALRDPADKVYRPRNADGTYTDIIQPQAAAVVLDYRTGELKAIVGGRTRPTQRKTLNRAADMKMPVGSSIKPIAVYAPALELGGSPASVVYNIPAPIPGWKNAKGEDAWPQNFGGGGYVGAETLREAMNKSHNTAAAQALMTLVGIDRSVDFLMQMGVDKDHIDATPFGLSLGSSGITPLQMSVAFSVLANGGVYQQPLTFIRSEERRVGKECQ
jgi:penicillin-binding protein 1A